MRKLLGGIVLVAGVAGLGYWGSKNHALDMQSAITERAVTATANSVHGVQTQINGRDIRVTGLADSEAERDSLLGALNDVKGRRVVRDDLEVLPTADPYTIAGTRKAGQTLLQGNVPTEAARAELGETAVSGVEGLTLASGAPAGWQAAIGSGLGTLSQMDEGSVSLTGTDMRLTGLVDTPQDRDALVAMLDLPEGYTLTNDIETRDDGKPIAYDVNFDAARGLSVDGKLPKGLDLAQIGDALGVSAITGEAKAGIMGDGSADLAILGKLKNWLPEMQTAQISISDAGTNVTGTAEVGVNAALVEATLKEELDGAATLSLAASNAKPDDGATRINAATGQDERFEYGAWLPNISFTPSLETCAEQTDALLAKTKINFLSGSADLGPRSLRAINGMAAIVGRCVREAGLVAELGGHTDNTGSGNFELSAARAEAVRDAMIARGIDGEALSSAGFGPSKPIADNATAEGRAANRRTTVLWTQR
ncbi:OmpA family protein [Planktotalea sp.]|uniref:OmpA family protein n=1 Tax=Planktotalea sp. TaxID=2029877 RepID=UPI003296B5C3